MKNDKQTVDDKAEKMKSLPMWHWAAFVKANFL